MNGRFEVKKKSTAKFIPAFRHRVTKEVVLSPGFHNILIIPGLEDTADEDLIRVSQAWEDGFVVTTPGHRREGEFFARHEVWRVFGFKGESGALRSVGRLEAST